jgi:toxin secretion/phage lysis holin
MADIFEKVLKALAIAGGAAMGLLGGWTPLLTTLAVFMVLDYITGLAVAFKGKSTKSCDGLPSSKAGFEGLMRKGGIVAVVFMGAMLDRALGTQQSVFVTSTAAYFVANEGLSILENVGMLGVKVPGAIRKGLEMIDKSDDNNEEPRSEERRVGKEC